MRGAFIDLQGKRPSQDGGSTQGGRTRRRFDIVAEPAFIEQYAPNAVDNRV